ncbi:hypothetical protein AX16_010856 [Volvariella volvacea WC 439]|nr:hypothetical protein AX16_010856 [Volvariella volvacea WC 439]
MRIRPHSSNKPAPTTTIQVNKFRFCYEHGSELCMTCDRDFRHDNNAVARLYDRLSERLGDDFDVWNDFDIDDRDPLNIYNIGVLRPAPGHDGEILASTYTEIPGIPESLEEIPYQPLSRSSSSTSVSSGISLPAPTVAPNSYRRPHQIPSHTDPNPHPYPHKYHTHTKDHFTSYSNPGSSKTGSASKTNKPASTISKPSSSKNPFSNHHNQLLQFQKGTLGIITTIGSNIIQAARHTHHSHKHSHEHGSSHHSHTSSKESHGHSHPSHQHRPTHTRQNSWTIEPHTKMNTSMGACLKHITADCRICFDWVGIVTDQVKRIHF